ncbi:MAG: hypothetical protein JZU64_04990 [Rhodoferax sp.]|jgi:hypothetical protein|nr:hypothetical protein [Rhodoferax sp.]
MSPYHTLFTVLQASQRNPNLANLLARQKDAQDRLLSIKPLIPPALRAGVLSGPLEDGVWCLLASNNTTAAKLRQLLPAFEAHLRVQQLEVTSIRLKVQREKKP